MTGFDFAAIWTTTTSYPELREQPATASIEGSLSTENGVSLDGDVVGAFYESDESTDDGGADDDDGGSDGDDNVVGEDTEVAADGTFEIDGLAADQTYNLVYGDDDIGEERNGVPDLYAIKRVTPPAEVEETLPQAHNVSIRVTDQFGNPIEDADLVIRHTNGDAVVEDGVYNATNETGYVSEDGSSQLEFNGSLTVQAEFNGVNNSTDVTVDDETDITVELPGATVNGTINTTTEPPEGDTVSVFTLTDDGVEGIDTTVGENGQFEIGGLSPDREYMLAFGDKEVGDVTNGVPDLYAIQPVSPSSADQNISVGEVDIPEAYNVSVQVVDQDGEPIEGADVAIGHTNGDAIIEDGERNATNESGYFFREGDAPLELVGNVTVGAAYRGVNNTTNVPDLSDDRKITVQLSGSTVTGTVRDADDDAVPNATITYLPIEDGEFDDDREVEFDETDDTGSYELSLTPGDYQVLFRQGVEEYPIDGVPDVYSADQISVSGQTQNDISLPEGNRLQIRLVNQSGDPLSNETIEVNHRNEEGFNSGVALETNETGWAYVGGTPGLEVNGTVDVLLESDSYYAQRDLEVTENETVILDARGLLNVTGNLTTADDTDVTEGEVFAQSPKTGHYADTELSPDGEFRLSLLRNASYELGFRQDGIDTQTDFPEDGVPDVQSLTRVETGTDDIDLATQQLGVGHPFEITVKNPDGSNASGVNVYVSDNNVGEEFAVSVTGETNENGSVVLDGAESPGVELNGSIDVYVDAPEDSGLADTNRRNVVVDEPGGITVQFQPAASVNGTILESDGETPAAGEVVQVNPVGDGVGDTVPTDENGFFDARVAADGAYHVGFVQGDADSEFTPPYPQDGTVDVYAIANVTSAQEAELGTVTLPEAHNLTVNVFDPSGDRVEDATIEIWSTANDAYQWGGDTTVSDGTLTVEANGSLDIRASAPEGTELRTEYERVNVTEEDTVNVTLDRNVTVSGSVEYWNGDGVSGYRMELFSSGDGGDYRPTNDSGYFELYPEPNQFYALGFKQIDVEGDRPNFPKDGRPDLHTFSAIELENEDRDVGDLTLPPAHLVNVTVEYTNGEPVSGATVDLQQFEGAASSHHPGTTNATGEVVLDGASSPGIEVNGTLRVGVRGTDDYAWNTTEFEIDSERNVTVVVRERVNVTGQLENESGDSLTDFDVLVGQSARSFVSEEVNDTGQFAVPVGANQTYSVAVGQRDAETDTLAPRDGVTDLYELTTVKVGAGDYDLAEQTVPDAHGVLNVSVENESGVPVENALVTIVPNQSGTPEPTSARLGSLTDERGYLVVGDKPGIEAAGNYTVRVERPPNAEQFVDETYVREVNVTEAGGDENVTVTLNEVDTTEPESDISIQSASAVDDNITVGDQVIVDVTLENQGDAEGETTVELTSADGSISASETTSVPADGTASVDLQTTIDSADTYDLTVTAAGDSVDVGSVTVEEPTEPANVTIADAGLSRTDITADETVLVNVTLQNTGDEEGEINLSLYRGEGIMVTSSYNVSAGDTRTVTYEMPFPEAGTYDVSAQVDTGDQVEAGTVNVEEESSTETPGFGIVPAVVALLGAAMVLRRRR
ncbi:PGF-CTERM sorting domain-containing protein [Halobellus limi]|nr:PGF-CTERM sorting domain-containing protein [Halobellus limi]